jgi:hypothetical protein
MSKFSVQKLRYFIEFALLIAAYIGYIIFVVNSFIMRGNDLVISLWLIFSIFTVIWLSYSLLKIKSIKRRIRRLFVLSINLILNNRIVWAVLGTFNKRIPFIKTVFLAYPANHKFATEYVFDNMLEQTSWNPLFTGFFIQNGKIGIQFAISSTEQDFRDENNIENLRILWLRMNYLKSLLEADQMTFAGILPGLFYKKNIIHTLPIELDVTVKAVKQAVLKAIDELNLPDTTSIIVLGGKGFIGNKFVAEMGDREVYCIDKQDLDSPAMEDILKKVKEKVIILNVATQKALQENLLYFNEKVIIINEVYPEPSRELTHSIKERGVTLFHIIGVKGKAFPNFPRAYRGGIPCCASWDNDNLEVKITQL